MTFQSDIWRDPRPAFDVQDRPFRLVADDAPIMIWVTDVEGKCTFLSRLWFQTTGQVELEGLGSGWIGALHPDDREGAARSFIEAGLKQSIYRAEYRLRRRDGSWAWVIDTGQPRFTSDDEFQGYVGCVLDISDRKHAEELLRKSVEHYRSSVELNPHIPWTAAPDGSVLEMSSRWEALTGMPADQARGTGWTQALHPADLALAKTAWSDARRLKTPVDVDYRLAMLDGTYRWFRARGAPRWENGEIILWYGSVEDIHDRRLTDEALRENEERLRLAIEASQAGVIDVDPVSNEHRWSDKFREMIGTGPEIAASYEHYLALVHPDYRPYASRQIVEVQEDEGAFATIDIVGMTRADTGETRFHERHIRKIRNEEGLVSRIVVVVYDVTERQKADEAIRWVATHDSLTQLPNREMFQDCLCSAIAEAQESGRFWRCFCSTSMTSN